MPQVVRGRGRQRSEDTRRLAGRSPTLIGVLLLGLEQVILHRALYPGQLGAKLDWRLAASGE